MEKLNHEALVSFSVEGHSRADWRMLGCTFVWQRQKQRYCVRGQNVMFCYQNSRIKGNLLQALKHIVQRSNHSAKFLGLVGLKSYVSFSHPSLRIWHGKIIRYYPCFFSNQFLPLILQVSNSARRNGKGAGTQKWNRWFPSTCIVL